MHVKVSVYRESFFFFYRTTQCRSKTSCRPGHRQSPLSFPQPRYIPHERFLVVENLGQPLYSSVLQLVFERTRLLTEGDTRYFPTSAGSRVVREPFVNGDRFHGNHRLSWRMMWKICKPLFHFTFQRICDCIGIEIGKWFVKLKTWRRRFPRLCKWESISPVQMLLVMFEYFRRIIGGGKFFLFIRRKSDCLAVF